MKNKMETKEKETFKIAIKLLRDLADLQIDAPRWRDKEEWEALMKEIYAFLLANEE